MTLCPQDLYYIPIGRIRGRLLCTCQSVTKIVRSMAGEPLNLQASNLVMIKKQPPIIVRSSGQRSRWP